MGRRRARKTVRADASRTRRRARPNSIEHDWPDEALVDHWGDLVATTKASELPDLNRASFVQLGCGAWGCVMPTNRKGRVVKITSDASEAAFVAAALQIGLWPAGVVRYQRLVELAGSEVEGDRIYALWREEADDVGELERALEGFADPPKEFPRQLLQEGDLALRRAMRPAIEMNVELSTSPDPQRHLKQARTYFDEAVETWLSEGLEPGYSESNKAVRLYGKFEAMRDPYAARFAWKRAEYDLALDNVARVDPLADVAGALRFYLERDMVLPDVLYNNMGYVSRRKGARRRLVITDPGGMVPCEPRWLSVSIHQLRPSKVRPRKAAN